MVFRVGLSSGVKGLHITDISPGQPASSWRVSSRRDRGRFVNDEYLAIFFLEVTLLCRVRAVAGYRVTVGRVVTVETLRVTELV